MSSCAWNSTTHQLLHTLLRNFLFLLSFSFLDCTTGRDIHRFFSLRFGNVAGLFSSFSLMLKDFGWTSTEAEDGRLLLLAVSFGAATVEKLRTLNLRVVGSQVYVPGGQILSSKDQTQSFRPPGATKDQRTPVCMCRPGLNSWLWHHKQPNPQKPFILCPQSFCTSAAAC